MAREGQPPPRTCPGIGPSKSAEIRAEHFFSILFRARNHAVEQNTFSVSKKNNTDIRAERGPNMIPACVYKCSIHAILFVELKKYFTSCVSIGLVLTVGLTL